MKLSICREFPCNFSCVHFEDSLMVKENKKRGIVFSVKSLRNRTRLSIKATTFIMLSCCQQVPGQILFSSAFPHLLFSQSSTLCLSSGSSITHVINGILQKPVLQFKIHVILTFYAIHWIIQRNTFTK